MEKKTTKNMNSEIVPELIQLIFSKLPFVNLPSCRRVCNAWNNLVLTCKFHPPISTSNLFFVHKSSDDGNFFHCIELDPKHLEGMSSVAKFSFPPDFSFATISIVNSCNGLLYCFFGHGPTKTLAFEVGVFILNPMTNEYFKPPTLDNEDYIQYYSYYGFGFSPKTNQYKLARLSSAFDKRTTLVEIFTLSISRKWTTISFLPPYMKMGDHGVYFNGGLYWVGTHQKQFETKFIYRLDIEDEEFREISVPQSGRYYFIGVFNDTICLTLSTFDLEYTSHVWMMEEDFSWTKAFDFVIPKQYLHPTLPTY